MLRLKLASWSDVGRRLPLLEGGGPPWWKLREFRDDSLISDPRRDDDGGWWNDLALDRGGTASECRSSLWKLACRDPDRWPW